MLNLLPCSLQECTEFLNTVCSFPLRRIVKAIYNPMNSSFQKVESYAVEPISENMGKNATTANIKPWHTDHNRIVILTITCYVFKSRSCTICYSLVFLNWQTQDFLAHTVFYHLSIDSHNLTPTHFVFFRKAF